MAKVIAATAKKTPSYLDRIAKKLNVPSEQVSIKVTNHVSTFTDYDCNARGSFKVLLQKNPKAKSRQTVAKFSIVGLPGCCGVAVSCLAYVSPGYRKKGLGKLLNELRLQIAHEWGYSCVIATNIQKSDDSWGSWPEDKGLELAQRKILRQNNWRLATKFHNRRSGNTVGVHYHLTKRNKIPFGFYVYKASCWY